MLYPSPQTSNSFLLVFFLPRLCFTRSILFSQENKKDFRLTERQREIVHSTAGFASHRKVILSPRISNDNCKSSENAAIPVPTLEFSTLALRNAEILLNRLTIPNSTEGKYYNWFSTFPGIDKHPFRSQMLEPRKNLILKGNRI